jgi:hypothetical protein
MSEQFEHVCLWPCGDWCYQQELEEMLLFKSDDYEVITVEELTERTGESL